MPLKIGLTYDLRDAYLAEGFSEEQTAEFDKSDTIDFLETAIAKTDAITERIGHARDLVQALAAGRRWDLVFNICEGLYGSARESQVPAILDVYNIPYTFSDTLVTAYCLDKALTKTILAAHNLPTPEFFTVTSKEDVFPKMKFPLFAKPVAEGTSKGISSSSRLESEHDLRECVFHLLEKYNQNVLVESYLPGREFTVGILGTGKSARALGTLEIILKSNAEQGVYSYANKENCEELVEYKSVTDATAKLAEQIALKAWDVLACRDAGRVDLRCDIDGKPQIIEVNPLSGLHPTHSDLPMLATAVGLSYEQLIAEIVLSAKARIR